MADVNGDGIPDLVVANTGSNDVSVLLGQGTGSSWTMVAGPRIKTDAGPVAVAVGDVLGNGQLDLAVANKAANNVEVFPSLGSGFFNDTAPDDLCRRAGAERAFPGRLRRLGHFDRDVERGVEYDSR